ncbi:MAG: CoA-binding protein, partial [Thermotogae bacterium]
MSLDAFFKAKSVAIIGASHKPGKIGHEIVKNLVRNKYRGKIFPVNPNTEPILGLKVFSSLKDIKGKIDLAIIALPAKKVLTALK